MEEGSSKLMTEYKRTWPCDIAFRLYDTFGFPLDLTDDILRNEGMTVDQPSFEQLMEEQRSRGRDAREVTSMDAKIQLDRPVSFVGYDRLEAESIVLAIYGNGNGKR